MRLILFALLIMMIARVISDIVIYVYYEVNDVKNKSDDEVFIVYGSLYDLIYIENRLSLILLYGLLTHLKYA